MCSTLLVLLLLATPSLSLADAFKFTCPEVNSSAAPPIVNSSFYSYKVLISVEGKNETVEAYEMYDMDKGSIRLFVDFPDPTNNSEWVSESIHHDYANNQTLTIDIKSKSCVVSDLSNETYSIFGLGIEEGFQRLDYPYYWRGDYNYTQENNTVVYGVTAERYSTCLLFNESQIKYDVELYFSVDDWNTVSGSNIPLMVVLKVNQTTDGGEKFLHEAYTYTFSSYHSGSADSWYFGDSDPHWDIICPGRKDAIPAPRTSNTYSLVEEAVHPDRKTIFSVRRSYNYDEKLQKREFVAPKNFTWSLPNHRHEIIHDFRAGVEYILDKELGNCTINPLTQTSWDFDVVPDPTRPGYSRMRDYAEFYNDRNYTYTGRHVRQGLSIDTWTSAVPYKQNTTGASHETDLTLIFSTPDWKSSEVSPVPLGIRATVRTTTANGTRKSVAMIHLSSVVPMQGIREYEIGRCFDNNSSKHFVIKFDDSFGKYIQNNSRKIDAAIRTGVANAANISQLRVSGWSTKEVAVDASDGSNNPGRKLFVSFHMYDHPNIHGNITEYTPMINLTEAVAKLRDVVSSNKLQIEFTSDTGENVVMTAYPGYLKEASELYSPAQPTVAPESRLSTGAIVGLSIGMLFLGVIIGIIIAHIRYKRGNRQFGYSMQD